MVTLHCTTTMTKVNTTSNVSDYYCDNGYTDFNYDLISTSSYNCKGYVF